VNSVQTRGRDRLTQARRSWNMSRIRGKDTTPERIVRSLLHRMG
jgi:DNA mismatch endonuclease (patch repair protein)